MFFRQKLSQTENEYRKVKNEEEKINQQLRDLADEYRFVERTANETSNKIEELIELLMSKEKLKQILDDIKEAKTKMETAIRDKDKLDLEWRENFGFEFFFFFFKKNDFQFNSIPILNFWSIENTKSQLEMDLAKAKLMGGSGAVTNISEEDLNKLFGNVGTENSAMKKIVNFFLFFFI